MLRYGNATCLHVPCSCFLQHFFMRVYPKGIRISSSNLNPSLFWRQGVQMVALNWQKCDKGVMLNEAMFANTGGWVLKPTGFRSNESNSSRTRPKIVDITIEFLAAQNIPLPPQMKSDKGFKAYVKCTLHAETLGTSSPPSRVRSRERRRSIQSDRRMDKVSTSKQTTVSATSKAKVLCLYDSTEFKS